MSEAPDATLRRMINGLYLTQAIHVAAELAIADALASGPRAADDIAGDVGAHPESLYRLMRALASVGVLHEDESRRFSLTPIGACLRSDAKPSLLAWAKLFGRGEYWNAWGALLHSVRTGDNAFRAVHGMDAWEHRKSHAETASAFNRAMSDNTRWAAEAIASVYDFRRFKRIVDVGGGHGTLLACVLAGHASGRGVLFDLPEVVAGARAQLANTSFANIAHRCDILAGSFFDSVPDGGDAYSLKTVLHDWEDAEAHAILCSCRRAMRQDAVLLIIERLLAGPNEGAEGKLSDLNMLVVPGGRERTEEQYSTLLRDTGFRLTAVVRTATPYCILEAAPVSAPTSGTAPRDPADLPTQLE